MPHHARTKNTALLDTNLDWSKPMLSLYRLNSQPSHRTDQACRNTTHATHSVQNFAQPCAAVVLVPKNLILVKHHVHFALAFDGCSMIHWLA